MNKLLGYGSFFHAVTPDGFNTSHSNFMEEYQLFYTGRYALKAVFNGILQEKPNANIWLPNYYCPFVKDWLEKEFRQIRYYNIDPFDTDAVLDYKQFPATDIVLFNNYWGLKENSIPEGSRPIIVEDHSHGWLSPGCGQSNADFCIASLRKTLPVPLAGIAWKPKNSNLSIDLSSYGSQKTTAENPMVKAWNGIQEAMILKSKCDKESDKKRFLEVHGEGESILGEEQRIWPLDIEHEKRIREYLFLNYDDYKEKNLTYITGKIVPTNHFKILETKTKGIPFGLLLIFKEREMLQGLKSYLIQEQIYPAELWPKNEMDQKFKYLLNVHMDFRYSQKDLDYILARINNWNQQQTA
ncbi:hypothetical protein DZC72_14405 [Maribacter algicola]|uniref:DegT/DnrJ/EryC1/StrS aminotransferase family protein n=1 Tax=Maribacter algicola TaxID=2498892 RepID=A0A426RIS2_9FLAO|nr:hypothetical protein [Maribacter algicola]RRQ48852.1 hypothetical protein DZC72_14405 [Maribacter algicola]